MNSRSLGILAIVTAVAAVLAYWTVRKSGPAPAEESPKAAVPAPKAGAASARLLELLDSKLNDAAEIAIQGKDKSAVLKKSGTNWVVASKSDYPAQFDKVKEAIIGLAELTVVEPKTAKSENYELLGLTDIDAPGVKDLRARRVTVKDAGGQTLASVIIGDVAPARGTGADAGTHVYVRRAGEAQTYEAKGRIDVRNALDPDPMMWLTREVTPLTSDRVKGVTITREGGERIIIHKDKKEDPDYKLAELPAGRELKYAGALSPVATAAGLVSFDDVARVADVAPGASPVGTAEYTTWDGVVLTAEASTKDGKHWVTFAARYDEPEPVPSDQPPPEAAAAGTKTPADLRKETDELNARLAGWAFAVPDYKVKQIVTTLDELLKPVEVKQETAAPKPADEPNILEKPKPEK